MAVEKVTRRTWTALVAGTAARLNAGQAPRPNDELRRAAEVVSKVNLARATPPAFRFDPR
jgi:hypothetical protein